MQYLSVQARAFGALRDRELELAPGLNVIHGSNEAGKSTWHAALYLALCGARRGRGRGRERERQILERYRPRIGSDYSLATTIELEDGRRVELVQDLDGKVDCTACEALLGHDLSSGIIHEGAPDGARWMQLDRASFLATACVEQGDLLEVLLQAEALQEQLQRAADTSGVEATAQRALEILDRYRREQVGSDQPRSQRPLARARQRLDEARACREAREEEFAEHARLLEELSCWREREEELQGEVRKVRGALDFRRAHRGREKLEQATRLEETLEELEREGEESARRKRLAARVRSALQVREACQLEGRLQGPPVAELRRELEQLSDGSPQRSDLDSGVVETHEAYRRTLRAIDDHDLESPSRRSLAHVVRGLAVTSCLLLGAAVSVPSGHPGLALSLALLGGGGALLGLVLSIGETLRTRLELRLWQRTHAELEAEASELERRLGEALREAVGSVVGGDGRRLEPGELERAFQLYLSRRRRREGREGVDARRREILEEIERRKVDETSVRRLRKLRGKNRRRLLRLAREAGLEGGDETELATRLASWAREVEAGDGEERALEEKREELLRLLGERSLDGLRRDVEESIEEVRAILEEFDLEEIRHLARQDGVSLADLEEARREAREATAELARRLGQIQERELHLGSRVEAEEEVERARREVERLLELDETIELTRGFLEEARDEVHRDLAPRLVRFLEKYLATVTLGAYDRARVDPRTLRVQVRSSAGDWIEATALSRGTAEQIYLLLRAALADELTGKDEVCPLLLDEVTVHCDARRKTRILETLKSLAADRQVILFSQEQAVLDWAREHLEEGRDRLIQLKSSARVGETSRREVELEQG